MGSVIQTKLQEMGTKSGDHLRNEGRCGHQSRLRKSLMKARYNRKIIFSLNLILWIGMSEEGYRMESKWAGHRYSVIGTK